MKTNVHLPPYLAQFFLEWEMFQVNVEEKIETQILCSTAISVPFVRQYWKIG
jgi:hypothetical protein